MITVIFFANKSKESLSRGPPSFRDYSKQHKPLLVREFAPSFSLFLRHGNHGIENT